MADWVGKDAFVLGVLDQAFKAAAHNATMLLEGETGTGKELIARMTHDKSPNAQGPFVAVNCGAIPANLFESELFGHTAGAFTGASQDRVGLVESADGGTLFLDEIGEVPLSLQVKLLRLLQEGEVVRVGDSQPRPVRLRLVAATNRDLADLVKKKQFREDLFYRLNVVHLTIPPLRERPTDILPLAEHFVEETAKRLGQHPRRIAAETASILKTYEWPGNTRELANAVEYLMIYCDGMSLDESGLPDAVLEGARQNPLPQKMDLKRRVELYEKRLIRQAMRQAGGVKAKAARILGVKRTTLVLKMQRYGMAQGRDDNDRGDNPKPPSPAPQSSEQAVSAG